MEVSVSDKTEGIKSMINRVLVVGYGIMGRGIARSFARGGHDTTVLSRDPAKIRDLPDGVAAVAELPAEPPDLVTTDAGDQPDGVSLGGRETARGAWSSW